MQYLFTTRQMKPEQTILLFLVLGFFVSVGNRNFKIGLLSYNGCCFRTVGFETSASAITIATEDLKTRGILPENCSISVVWQNARTASVGIGATIDFVRDMDVDVIFGSPSSMVNIPVAHLMTHWNMPQISWVSTNPEFTDKNTFRTFIRTLGPFSKVGIAFVELFRKFGWKHVGVLNYGSGLSKYSADGVRGSFHEANITIEIIIEYTTIDSDADIDGYLQRLKDQCRIIVLSVSSSQLRRFLLRACAMNMCNGEFLFVTPWVIPSDTFEEELFWSRGDENDEKAKEAYRYLLYVTIAMYATPAQKDKLTAFRRQIPLKMLEPPWNSSFAVDNNYTGSPYSIYLYDATYLYGLWLNYTLGSNGTVDPRDGRALFEFTKEYSFESVTGPCQFDNNGDRQPFYWIWDFMEENGYPRIAALANTMNPPMQVIEEWKGFEWNTRNGLPPVDIPVCGLINDPCPLETSEESNLLALAVSISVFSVIISVLIIAYFIRKRQLENEMMKMAWKVAMHEIELVRPKNTKSLAQLSNTAGSLSLDNVSFHAANSAPNYLTNKGIFRGHVVALRNLKQTGKSLTKKDLAILKQMREMTHDNINLFHGACVDTPSICVIFSYCNKGSLQDILENDEINLDSMFQHSLASDLVNGMIYLHASSLKSHGRLKSTNCLVDDRWILKITDYGLQIFTHKIDQQDLMEFDKSRLWTAPELLRMPNPPAMGTQDGDVYSFGIILHEIFFRLGTFPVPDLTLHEILGRVQIEQCIPCRPDIPKTAEGTVPPPLILLMQLCWHETPKQRPTFSTIKRYLRKNFQSANKNIMDVMLNKLEKYASNLEDLVGQRTLQLLEEKKKTDRLLYRMLPASVAEKLKVGQAVIPELFASVTVYFSDIVGFTSIAALSTPIEVVDLLNDLYSMVDGIIAKHDAYKVETIGDAYLVVSGLPTRNGNLHSGAIADLALDVMGNLKNFRIKHMPDREVMMRIGIHTGPCCAGVVGLSTPRYCLFGDTVNTASRMESNGQSQKIHISEATKQALLELGGYDITFRDEMFIKGKGQMKTYWLDGKADVKLELQFVE